MSTDPKPLPAVQLDMLLKLVIDMRRAQKRYFRTREEDAFRIAKELERKVDELCDDLDDRQGKLF